MKFDHNKYVYKRDRRYSKSLGGMNVKPYLPKLLMVGPISTVDFLFELLIRSHVKKGMENQEFCSSFSILSLSDLKLEARIKINTICRMIDESCSLWLVSYWSRFDLIY